MLEGTSQVGERPMHSSPGEDPLHLGINIRHLIFLPKFIKHFSKKVLLLYWESMRRESGWRKRRYMARVTWTWNSPFQLSNYQLEQTLNLHSCTFRLLVRTGSLWMDLHLHFLLLPLLSHTHNCLSKLLTHLIWPKPCPFSAPKTSLSLSLSIYIYIYIYNK